MFPYEIYQFYQSATVADPNLQNGGGVSQKIFFSPSWPHFGPTPGSATVVTINPLSSKVHIQILQADLYTSLLRLVWRIWLKIKCFHFGGHVNVVVGHS